jgi:Tol biopolymer transport system component
LVAEQNGIYVASLDGKQDRRILPDYSSTTFAPAQGERGGHLLFVREGALMALPFDAASAQAAGDVFPVTEGVSLAANTTSAYAPVTVSQNGVLLYATGGVLGTNQMGWYDRAGKPLGAVSLPGAVYDPAISPDEKSVAFRRLNLGSTSDLWVRDLSRLTETPFTGDPSFNAVPQWSPHGDRIVFSSNRKNGVYNLYQKTANGSGQDELLLNNMLNDVAYQWSRDGRFIVYYQAESKTKVDLWVLPMDGVAGDRKPIPFLQTEANDLFGQLSPDSHWMAFTSDRSGRREVYVRPFPPGEGEWPISIAGGEAPRWRADGKEMYFEAADGKMMSVAIKAVPGPKAVFEAGAPVAMFDAHMARSTAGQAYAYDVTADGKRFLINTVDGGAGSAPPLTVVTNWTAALKK